jgi:hypothetical protein
LSDKLEVDLHRQQACTGVSLGVQEMFAWILQLQNALLPRKKARTNNGRTTNGPASNALIGQQKSDKSLPTTKVLDNIDGYSVLNSAFQGPSEIGTVTGIPDGNGGTCAVEIQIPAEMSVDTRVYGYLSKVKSDNGAVSACYSQFRGKIVQRDGERFFKGQLLGSTTTHKVEIPLRGAGK